MAQLLKRLQPVLYAGLVIAAIRYAMDWIAPDSSMGFGLYIAMPLVLLHAGLRGRYDDLGFKILPGLFVTGFLIWFASGIVAYPTGALLDWEFGRHRPMASHEEIVTLHGERNALRPPGAPEIPLETIEAEEQKKAAIPFVRPEGTGPRLAQCLLIASISSLAGALWCALFGALFIGLPAKLRGRS